MASAAASKSCTGTPVAGGRNNLVSKHTFAVCIYLTVVSYANGANNSAVASKVCPDLVRTISLLRALFCKTSDLLPLFAGKVGKGKLPNCTNDKTPVRFHTKALGWARTRTNVFETLTSGDRR